MNKIKQKFLVDRIRKGDSESFREIYQTFSDRIYRFIFFRIPNETDAQDLLQETFLKLWDYLNNKKNEVTSLQALLYKIAKNLVASYYVKNQARLKEISIEEIEYKVGEDENLEQEIDIQINIKKVEQKLSQLKNPEHQEIVRLRFLDDLSHKQIAELLNKSEKNIGTTLHRAIKKLKEILDEE